MHCCGVQAETVLAACDGEAAVLRLKSTTLAEELERERAGRAELNTKVGRGTPCPPPLPPPTHPYKQTHTHTHKVCVIG